MLILDTPTLMNERIVCSVTAALKYQVPPQILLAIAEKEGGKPLQWNKNKNGTYDVGVMQFNTQYLKDLEPYGITAEDVAQKGCFPYDLAALRLKEHLEKDRADIYTRASNYHSRTPKYNAIYREDLIKKSQKWGEWLNENFTNLQSTERATNHVYHELPVLKVSHLKSEALPTAQAALAAFYAPNRLEFYRKSI